jgi:hypothetical protein
MIHLQDLSAPLIEEFQILLSDKVSECNVSLLTSYAAQKSKLLHMEA